MREAAIPENEAIRLQQLRALKVLDSAPEAQFDALVRAASLVCGTPISLISLVDQHRQWFKANVGLEGAKETARSLAFCAHAIHSAELFEVADATADPRFRDNPLVTGAPDIRFYAGAPLVLADGSNLGTLCVIDREPRTLDGTQREILACLARAAVKALEHRRAAIELAESERRQRQLGEALALAHGRRGEFLATLAHELRNPLSAIRMGSELLEMTKDNWKVVEKVSGIVSRQVAHMGRLIEGLSDASKVDAGKIDLEKTDQTLAALLASAIENTSAEVERGRHSLLLDVPNEPVRVHVDDLRITQVIGNLLSNAAKYTPAGGTITLRARVSERTLLIEVRDNGVGIEAELLPNVFGMFVQAPGSRHREKRGLGIGLAVVEHIVKLHGGTISAASEGDGKGSVFTVLLPDAVSARS